MSKNDPGKIYLFCKEHNKMGQRFLAQETIDEVESEMKKIKIATYEEPKVTEKELQMQQEINEQNFDAEDISNITESSYHSGADDKETLIINLSKD